MIAIQLNLFRKRKIRSRGLHGTHIVRAVLLVVIVLSLVAPFWEPDQVYAQANVNAPWVKFTRETSDLVSNNVLSILVGENELWFGTDNGISRFNGQWESFEARSSGIVGDVNALARDASTGTILAGTSEGNLLRWDGQKWLQEAQAPSAVTALHVGDGRVWVGTEGGLFLWTGASLVAVNELGAMRVQAFGSQGNVLWVGTDQGLWTYQRDKWTAIGPDDGLPGRSVTALWTDPEGPVWVAADSKIAWRNPTTGVWTQVSTEVITLNGPSPIIALVGDGFGDIWGAAYGSGPFRIRDGVLVAFSGEGENGLTTPFVQALAVDQDGLIWFGTATGVFRFDGRMWLKELGDNVAYPGINIINDILPGISSRIWIATGGAGIRMKPAGMSPLPERIYTDSDGGLPTNFVTSLVLDVTGTPWAGTFIGVVRYNEDKDVWEEAIPPESLPSELVSSLLADSQGVWIGTDKGLAYYDLQQNALVSEPFVGEVNIQAMALDSLNRLWVGTGNGLFMRKQDGDWVAFHATEDEQGGLLGDSIVALAADPNTSGAMWVAVQDEGINYWDGEQWLDYTDVIDVPSKILYRLYTDPVDGSLWIGSEGGVTHYDGRTAETLNVPGALPSASIFAIARDHDGNYWFGGRDGLTFHRPEHTPPWVRIERVNNELLDLFLLEPRVQADQDLLIDYAAGDLYTHMDGLRVLYRISGPERLDAWQVAKEQPIRLSGFQEGVYLIELQARDEAFNYSEVERLTVEVVPPPPMVTLPFLEPIRRDYFIALVVTGAIALIGFAYMSAEIAQSRRRAREAISRGFNPFVSGEPVRREDMFFGRDDLLQKIIDTLHNNSIMIHGERRIGKTTLLYQLAARLREIDDPEYWFIPLYIDLEGTTEHGFFHFLMEEILHGVLTLPRAQEELEPALRDLLYHEMERDAYSDREFNRDLRQVIQALEDYGHKYHPDRQLRLILLMDEMDVMSGYSRLVQQRLRRIFMRDFAATLGAVVAGIQISKEWDRVESPWFNLFNEIELKPFTREQALELLLEPVREYYQYEPAALEFIIEQSAGRPYRLQQYALESVNIMLADGRRTITLDDVEQAHEHIQHMGGDLHAGLDTLSGPADGMGSPEAAEAEDAEPVAAVDGDAGHTVEAEVKHESVTRIDTDA